MGQKPKKDSYRLWVLSALENGGFNCINFNGCSSTILVFGYLLYSDNWSSDKQTFYFKHSTWNSLAMHMCL